MKKRFVLLLGLALLLCLFPAFAAADGEETCEHAYVESWTADPEQIQYEQLPGNDAMHRVYGTATFFDMCRYCWKRINVRENVALDMMQRHSYTNGVCTECGYVNPCTHPNAGPASFLYDMDSAVYQQIDGNAFYHLAKGKGWTYTWWCDRCDDRIDGEYDVDVEVRDPHRYNEDGVCTRCGYVNACQHTNLRTGGYQFNTPTYTAVDDQYHTVTGDGYTYDYCRDCGAQLNKVDVPNMEKTEQHYYQNGVCSQCGHVNACQHVNTWENWWWDDWNSVTYTPKDNLTHTLSGRGYTYDYCRDCGQELNRKNVENLVKEEEHDYVDGVCSQCGHVNTCQHTRTYENTSFVNWNDVTYKEKDNLYHTVSGRGYTYTYCNDCGQELSRGPEGNVTAEWGHEYVNGVCSRCGHKNTCKHTNTFENWTYNDWNSVTYTPKDNSAHILSGRGYTYDYCRDCGQELNRKNVENLVKEQGHDYVDGVCSQCGHVNTCQHTRTYENTSFVNRNDVTYKEKDNLYHTVSGRGYTVTYCDDCYQELSRGPEGNVTAEWGHEYVNGVCSRCGHKNTCKHANTFENWTYNDWDSVTYTPKDNSAHILSGRGYTYDYCRDCGQELNRKNVENLVKEQGHDYVDGVCRECGHVNTCPHERTAKNAFDFDDWSKAVYTSVDDYTHTVSGEGAYLWLRCLDCGELLERVPEPDLHFNQGHAYGGGNVCSQCGHKRKTVKGLAITQDPQSTRVKNGEKAKFTVKISGKATGYQWYYRTSETAKWKKVSKATKATLTVTAKPANNGYQYRCEVKNANGKLTTRTAVLRVDLYPPVLVSQPESAAIRAGETATFTFGVEGEGVTYAWSYRKSATGKWAAVKGGTGATLKVTGKVANAGYQYKCDAKNKDGSVTSKVVTLDVEYHLPEITLQPKGAKVKKNAKVTFTVEADNPYDEELTFQWYYRKSSKAKWTKIKGATEATYSFKATAKKSGYQYKCDIGNRDGTVSTKAATLKVK